ncbi:biotin/lipoyl-containing protein [Nocardia abscessus]|uniref:biotin/lipoyl-containing protein n=1 Tax=Nocardia abscessus TaxID=120957 RepID=UPI003CC7F31E
MPSLGADMVEGTLLHWLVHPGDVVHKGDVVAEVDTTKAAIEIECFDDGVVGTILVPEGKTVPVGTPLATIGRVPWPCKASARACTAFGSPPYRRRGKRGVVNADASRRSSPRRRPTSEHSGLSAASPTRTPAAMTPLPAGPPRRPRTRWAATRWR